jgi:hypothetical protein
MSDHYWCLKHGRVEQGTACPAHDRLGPYATAEEARSWQERVERREDTWQAEDERWHGDDD